MARHAAREKRNEMKRNPDHVREPGARYQRNAAMTNGSSRLTR